MSLTFLSEGHVYKWEGYPVPSVSSILEHGGAKEVYDSPDSEFYMRRGTAVHVACEYFDQGILNIGKLDEMLVPYVNGWKMFREFTTFQPYDDAIERKLYHPIYQYAGTIDRVCLFEGVLTILDIKTGQPYPWHGQQLAAYELLVRHALGKPNRTVDPIKRMCVMLQGDNRFKIEPYNDDDDHAAWMASLTTRNWKEKHGLN